MSKIIGYEKEKAEIAGLRKMLKNAEKFNKRGVRIPRGLLLSGAPGVGKTELARELSLDGVPLIEYHPSECDEDDADGEIHAVFEEAKKMKPCIILLDEIDKMTGESRFFFLEGNNKVRNALLFEIDNLSSDDSVLVVATCNDEECMGDALLRPGRFDRIIRIGLPDETARFKILKHYFGKIRIRKNFSIEDLAKSTAGYSGAALECIVNEAGIAGMMKRKHVIEEDDIMNVINKSEFGSLEQNLLKDENDVFRTAVHEAGHAVVAMYCLPDTVHSASILPQGNSGGHTRLSSSPHRIMSVSDIEKRISVMLGGRAAEKVNLGECMLTASSDIRCATDALFRLYTKESVYGYAHVLMVPGPGGDSLISDNMRDSLAMSVSEKLEELENAAAQIIYDHPHVFGAIVAGLREKKTLSKEDLMKIQSEAEKLDVSGAESGAVA